MDVEELKQKAMAATPGPWCVTGSERNYVDAPIGGGRLQEVAWCGDCEVGSKADNAAYIAAANPATILALIAERDELLVALKKFGRHEKNCIQKMSSGFASCCTCGLGDTQDKVGG